MKLGGWLEKLGGRAGDKSPASASPMLGSPHRFPYGPFRFEIGLARGGPYEIHASSDLQKWTPLVKDAVSETTFDRPLSFEHLDHAATDFGHRFYRVFAGGVPSANVIGYVTTFLPPGFSMIANPFNAADNRIAALFADWPDDTTLHKFDTSLFRLTDNAMKHKVWSDPDDQFVPGEGALFFNPTPDVRPLTFVGDVMQENLSMPIPSGFSVRSSLVPQAGALREELGFPIADGDVVHLFDREEKKYLLHPFEKGRWTSGAPSVAVGESFWIAKKTAANWVRNLRIGS